MKLPQRYDSKTMGAGYNGAVQYDIRRPALTRSYPDFISTDLREVALLIRVTVRASSLDVQNLIPEGLIMNLC